MGRKAYSQTAKAEAVALGAVVGAEEAGRRLGITAGAVRNWMGKAGKAPADAITSSSWASLGALARSQVAADLVAGRVKPTQAAIIAGIADRNTKPDAPVTPPAPVEGWADQVEAMLDTTYGRDADLAMELVIEWLDGSPEVAANATQKEQAEHEPVANATPEQEAPDPAACLAYLAGLGDLHAHHAAQAVARHAAMEAQLAVNRQAAEAAAQRVLDAETRDLLAAAETWIREHPE